MPKEIDSIVYTDQFILRIDAIPPKTELTIVSHLYSPGRKGRGYSAKATFVADDAGTIDTSPVSLAHDLPLAALAMARQTRRPGPDTLHHSDRGRQYSSAGYRAALQAAGLTASMSRQGDCWDNAVVESFFATLKTELIHRRAWATRVEVQHAVFRYIEGWYNPHRLHSALGYHSPAQYEATLRTRSRVA